MTIGSVTCCDTGGPGTKKGCCGGGFAADEGSDQTSGGWDAALEGNCCMDEVPCIRGFSGWIASGSIPLDHESWWWPVAEGGLMGGAVSASSASWCLGVGSYPEKKDTELSPRGSSASPSLSVTELLIWDDCWGKANINNYMDGTICWSLMHILLLIIKRVIRYAVPYIYMEIVQLCSMRLFALWFHDSNKLGQKRPA